MLRGYVAIAARQLLRNKLFTAINVSGLAVGIAAAVLIALFVRHELSYDRQFAAADRIVRVSDDLATIPAQHYAGAAPIVAPLLKAYFPEIERSARLSTCFAQQGGGIVTIDDESFYAPNLAAADNELFQIFDFEWLQGDSSVALAEPRAAVVTESAARRYFGAGNALGRTFTLQGLDGPFEIKGVVRDLPDNTHLRFDLLISLQAAPAQALEAWGPSCYQTYALLAKKTDARAIQSRSGQFLEDRLQQGSSRFRGLTVMSIADIHLQSAREGEMRTPGSFNAVYAFSAVAVFLLLIAGVNFVNLTTARAVQRAKEVAVRKAIGGTRRQLVAQFLGESLLITAIAVAFSLALVAVSLPIFARFVERNLSFRDVDGSALWFFAAVAFLVALLAGSYPAFFLSAFRPVRVLRGVVARGDAAATVRKSLVVLQFSISIALAIATLVVLQQERFARGLDLGYSRDRIVVLSGSPARGLGPQWESLRNQWLRLPGVSAATASQVTPGTRSPVRVLIKPQGADGPGALTTLMVIDFGFFETYGIKILAGRPFSAGRGDRQDPDKPGAAAWVLSELAVKQLGWTPDDAVGRTFEVSGAPGVVIGVAADVHLESVRDAVTPVAYVVSSARTSPLREASLRVTGRDLERTLADVDATWRRFVPDSPVMRRFLDQDFDALYRGEQRARQMLTLFSVLAIAIAGLGLFGLASFTTLRRTKEIGIRKTLGASVTDIVWLFTSEFALLAALANVVAWPVAYVFMHRWLEGFAYHIEIGPVVFLASGALALIVAALTVATVAIGSARGKPAAALRYE